MKSIDDMPYAIIGTGLVAVGFLVGSIVVNRYGWWQLAIAPVIGAIVGFLAAALTLRDCKLPIGATMGDFKAAMSTSPELPKARPSRLPFREANREFNQRHRKQIIGSMVLYLGSLLVIWVAALFTLRDTRAALNTTLLALLAAHVVRIHYLAKMRDLKLTNAQYVTGIGAILVGLLLIILAYVKASLNPASLGWEPSRSIVLSLSLAMAITVYADFVIAALLRRLTGSIGSDAMQ